MRVIRRGVLMHSGMGDGFVSVVSRAAENASALCHHFSTHFVLSTCAISLHYYWQTKCALTRFSIPVLQCAFWWNGLLTMCPLQESLILVLIHTYRHARHNYSGNLDNSEQVHPELLVCEGE